MSEEIADVAAFEADAEREVITTPEEMAGVNAGIELVSQADGWRTGVTAYLPEAKLQIPCGSDREAFSTREDALRAACTELTNWSLAEDVGKGRKHRKAAEELRKWLGGLAPESKAVPVELPPARMIPLEELHESPLNPRQHYPEGPLAELAESMRTGGFHHWKAMVVRPRVEGGYEIGAGHRRYRAAVLAGNVTDVPCFVLDLGDDAFLDVLNFDNSGHERVHPLHEAAGWREWLQRTGQSVLDIARHIGKSKEYVYQRLQYAKLIPEAQREFLEDPGLTAQHAAAIARLTPENQVLALDYCKPPVWDLRRRRPGYRELEGWIREQFHRPLAQAGFDRGDVTLLPEAGACAVCPKNTVNLPDYESQEGVAEECTDLRCWDRKVENNVAQARALLAGTEFVQISTRFGKQAGKGVLAAEKYEEVLAEHAGRKGVRAALVTDGKRAGQVIQVQVRAEADPGEKERDAAEKAGERAREEAECKNAARRALILAIADRVAALDREAVEYLASRELDEMDPDEAAALGVDLRSDVAKLDATEFARFVLVVSLAGGWLEERIQQAAKRYGVDVAAVTRRAEAEYAIRAAGIDFAADRIECKGAKGMNLAEILFQAAKGGWNVSAFVDLPTKKGEGFGESGPLRTAGEIWKDRGQAISAAFEWMRGVLKKADKYEATTHRTRAGAAAVKEWIRKGALAQAAMKELAAPVGKAKPGAAAKKKATAKKKPAKKGAKK
jgi:ParB/RepB/Spo0J family partition protein